MFVFLNAVDGAVELHVENTVVGSARTATGLAQLFMRNGVESDDSVYCSSSIDFASEEGFESDGDAHELIEEAFALIQE